MKKIPALLLLWIGTYFSQACADPGKPVAVRWWGQAMVSIETYWNLHLVIDPYSLEIGYDDPQLAADLVLITLDHPNHNNSEIIRGEPVIVRGHDSSGKYSGINHVLDRWPNQPQPRWFDSRQRIARTPHHVTVTSILAWHEEEKKRVDDVMLLLAVDGVRIVHCGDLAQRELTPEQLEALGKVDLLLIPVGGIYTVDGTQAATLVEQIQPRIVVPIHYKTPKYKHDLGGVEPFVESLAADYQVARPEGNTLAVSAAKDDPIKEKQLVVLQPDPWQMPEELAELFAKKEAASQATEAVFAPLSLDQMNFLPSNGTHTPRWNAEHMMGRELGFFTEIYAQIDPAIKKIDLNPAQMPPDYQAAHPNWTGAEEARQIERVSSLSRRFAYLLADLPLEEKAPGSRWTPRGLLEQMARHYSEHTANVKEKFKLPDWPQK